MLDPLTRYFRLSRPDSWYAYKPYRVVVTMVSPLSRLHSKTFPAMSSILHEKENYEELNQIGNGKIHMVNSYLSWLINIKWYCHVRLKGAYGTVYKGRDLVNKGKFVAMKKIKIPLAQDGVPMTTLREIALLKQLDQQQHPNIVKYVSNISVVPNYHNTWHVII